MNPDYPDPAVQRAFYRALNIVGRATLPIGDDSKAMQTHQIVGYSTGDAPEVRNDKQHVGQFGISSMPLPGAKAVVLYQGGHRGFATIVGTEDPRYRHRGLRPGEVAVYAVDGADGKGEGGTMWPLFQGLLGKISKFFGRTIAIGDSSTMTIMVTGSSVTITGATGDVVVNGISLVHHVHPDPQGGVTGPPQ